jgi:hypothetical protein
MADAILDVIDRLRSTVKPAYHTWHRRTVARTTPAQLAGHHGIDRSIDRELGVPSSPFNSLCD